MDLGDRQNDAQLVKALRSGEKKALAILYDRYAGLVYSLAYKILQDRQEAEDLTQEIFLNFWKNNRYDPDRGALSSFLGLLARSRAIDKIRKRQTTTKFLDRWQNLLSEDASNLLPLEEASLQEKREQIQAALAQLPEMQRRVVEMNYFEGLSHSKIAAALDLSLGTVKSRARQGLVQLKKLLLANNAI